MPTCAFKYTNVCVCVCVIECINQERCCCCCTFVPNTRRWVLSTLGKTRWMDCAPIAEKKINITYRFLVYARSKWQKRFTVKRFGLIIYIHKIKSSKCGFWPVLYSNPKQIIRASRIYLYLHFSKYFVNLFDLTNEFVIFFLMRSL